MAAADATSQTPAGAAPLITPDEGGSLQVQKLRPDATAPTRGSQFAAGYDLYAAEETLLKAGGRGAVPTGIAIAVPVGTCMF